MSITYRAANIDDLHTVTELSVIMCSGDYCGEHEEDELLAFNKRDLLNPEMAMFIAFDGGEALGFAHVGLRHNWYFGAREDGTVGYLEAIFVCEGYRKRGVAQALLAMCEDWSRERGCVEFASDCDLENEGSLAFHLSTGFEETHRIIFFAKEL